MPASSALLNHPERHPPDARPFLASATAAADLARRIALEYFRRAPQVRLKADQSPVSAADLAIENAVRGQLAQAHPGHGFFGEEHGRQAGAEPWNWVLDPIDGTKSFIAGMPTFGSLLCLLHGEAPLLGIVEHPALAERWVGCAGRRTTHNDRPCHTQKAENLAEVSLRATTPDQFSADEYARFQYLAAACRDTAYGGDCYHYGLLASGYIGVVCEAGLAPYDFLALVSVVENAGGIISDWQGRPLTPASAGQVLASANTALHTAALNRLRAASV